jgi:hypothetical protein
VFCSFPIEFLSTDRGVNAQPTILFKNQRNRSHIARQELAAICVKIDGANGHQRSLIKKSLLLRFGSRDPHSKYSRYSFIAGKGFIDLLPFFTDAIVQIDFLSLAAFK